MDNLWFRGEDRFVLTVCDQRVNINQARLGSIHNRSDTLKPAPRRGCRGMCELDGRGGDVISNQYQKLLGKTIDGRIRRKAASPLAVDPGDNV